MRIRRIIPSFRQGMRTASNPRSFLLLTTKKEDAEWRIACLYASSDDPLESVLNPPNPFKTLLHRCLLQALPGDGVNDGLERNLIGDRVPARRESEDVSPSAC
jgi:hypothetical protein